MENMVNNIHESWMMISDLGEILSFDEKFRGCNFGSTSCNYLEIFMLNTGSIDLGFSGNIFILRNNKSGPLNIVDRAIVNYASKLIFVNAGLLYLATSSDYYPILLQLTHNSHNTSYPFRVLFACTMDPTCSNMIKKAWKSQILGSKAFEF